MWLFLSSLFDYGSKLFSFLYISLPEWAQADRPLFSMVSAVLASVLQSHLGQYLELSDTSISVGSEIKLNNVKVTNEILIFVKFTLFLFSVARICIGRGRSTSAMCSRKSFQTGHQNPLVQSLYEENDH